MEPCVLVRMAGRRVDGTVLLQGDDSLALGTDKFMEDG